MNHRYLGISDHVFMLGTRTDTRELINDMDVVTLFRCGGLPIVIIGHVRWKTNSL